MAKILVFDVNETLLDVNGLAPQFQMTFGESGVVGEWFSQVIQYAMGLSLADAYRPFNEVALAALQMVAESRSVRISEADARRIAGGIRSLPACSEVPEALARLKSAGFRMVVLTNSPLEVVNAQMAFTELQPFLERNFSVDTVRRYKPAPEPYLMVARELGVEPGELMMIAAHAWDVGGAMRAGYAGAFVARAGKSPFPLFRKPDITARDLREVADAIIGSERP